MSSEPTHNLENLLAQIGNANRFQFIMAVCNRAPVAFVAWTMVEMSLLKGEPRWCCIPQNINTTSVHYCYNGNNSFGHECHLDNVNCSHRLFEEGVNSIVNEWDLVCDSKWKASFSISIQMVGVLVGTTLTGIMANYLGRKKTFFISIGTLMILSFLTGLSTSWEIFLVLRFLLGTSCGTYYVVSIPYVMEFLSPSKRGIPALFPVIPLAFMVMSLCAWFLQDWRLVHWLCAALLFPMLSFWFFVPESLRWLTVKGRLDEAETVVAYVARINRLHVPEESRRILETVYDQERKTKEDGKDNYSYRDIYRSWDLFKLSILNHVLWFSICFCGLGITFGVSSLGLNMYLNFFLLSAVSIPVMVAVQVLLSRIGRRPMGITLTTIAMLCAFSAVVVSYKVSDNEDVALITTILCLIANSCLASVWSLQIIITNESYPTVLRTLGFAASNVAGRVGAILAPFAFDFSERLVFSYVLLGSLMGLCAFVIFLLNETKDLALQDTMQEAEVSMESSKSTGKRPLLTTDAGHNEKKYGIR